MPEQNRFGPLDGSAAEAERVVMTVDEYEAIRLIDLESYSQEACAERMNVSRSTVQSMYDGAREKIARAIVTGAVLAIEGGSYRLCEESCGGCRHRRGYGRFPDAAPCGAPPASRESEPPQENAES